MTWGRAALVAALCVVSPAASWAQATVTIGASQVDASGLTTYTFSGVDVGTAASDRYVGFFVTARRFAASSCSIGSATIDGSAATVHATVSANTTSGNCGITAFIYRTTTLTTGTTITATVTFSAPFERAGIIPVRLTGVTSAAPSIITSSTVANPTWTTTLSPYAVAVAVASGHAIPGNATWTGLTEAVDEVVEGGTSHTAAYLNPTTLQDAITTSAAWTSTTGSHDGAAIRASWMPNGPQHATPTHYVTTTGSGSSNCYSGDPCTLTRAFAIAGTMPMPPGSYVSIAAGSYVQAAITTTGGGSSLFRTRFVGAGANNSGTILSSLETPLLANVWTITTDATGCGGLCTYTYQTPFSNTTTPGGFQVAIFGQLPTASTWVPISVDSRSAPFTSGSGRAYTLDEPVKYTPQTSIASVELQHCTYYHNTTTDILYMHPCREGTPTDNDRYAAGRTGYGSLLYEGGGDYLTLENVLFWMHDGMALELENDALGNLFDEIKANGSKFWFKGNQTVATDFLLKQNITQGPPHDNCYSAQYGGGGMASRSCFSYNTSGSSEYLILIGQENTTGLNQSFDRIAMERAWNGYTMHGAQTLNHATCFGLDNHCGQAYGTGYTISNGMFQTSQDSLYLEGESFNNITITNNIFRNGVLIWCSRDGAHNESVCPTTWTFTENILGSIVLDTLSQPPMVSDCNAWIPRSAGATLLRITPVDGVGSDPQYTSLTAIQANTNDDDNSVFHDYPAMTNGTIFANHSSQETYPIDYTLASGGAAALTTSCGQVGPDTLESEGDVAPATGRLRFRVTP